MTTTLDPALAAQRLSAAASGAVAETSGDILRLHPGGLLDALRFLRDAPATDLVFLANLTAVDRETHFEVVYHLQSLDHNHLLTCKVHPADHEEPHLPSLTPLYTGAHLQERELFDLMGIRFDGHPDLRRMFLWDGFPGFPLRKDFLAMPGKLSPGLPGFPHEPGYNAWPVPGAGPRGGQPPQDGGAPPPNVPTPGGAPQIPGRPA